MPDVFHTFFGLGALSLMDCPDLKRIDPKYALGTEVVELIENVRN